MTSSLRRKRQITVPATITPARTGASLLGLVLALTAAPAWGQSPYDVTPPAWTGRVPSSPYQSAPAPAPAVAPDPTPQPMPAAIEVPAEPPALHFTKAAVGRSEAPASGEFHPDLMIQQAQMAGQPRTGPRLGPDQVRTSPNTPGTQDDSQNYDIQLEPPGALRLFRFESEEDLFRRVRQDSVNRPGTAFFDAPVEPQISFEEFAGRSWSPASEVVEPGYVCYGRLLFQDLNSERYGWDLGFIQPFVSLTRMWYDSLFLPYHAFEDPMRCCECNTGYCLPGDPVPYVIYPPHPSLAGAVAEATAVLGVIAIFP